MRELAERYAGEIVRLACESGAVRDASAEVRGPVSTARAALIEAMVAGYETNLVRALHQHQIPVAVANPPRVRQYARAIGGDAKTDLLHAEVIAA